MIESCSTVAIPTHTRYGIWATATQRALVRAGVRSQLEWHDDGHAFGPAFNAAMDRTVQFFDGRLG